MNQVLMSQYIEFVADRLVVQLGYPKIYNSATIWFYGNDITSGKLIFEKRVGDYSLSQGNKQKMLLHGWEFN